MSDDLAKRLREDVFYGDERLHNLSRHNPLHMQAADRIEELEAKLDWVLVERDETFALMLDRAQTAEAKLAKAMEFISNLKQYAVAIDDRHLHGKTVATLAELKGGKDE